MKKNFCKVIALLFVVTMMMTTVAFADAAIGTPAVAEQVVTVTLSGLVAGEEATILVVNKDVALTAVQDADIVYINQDTIAENGTVEFELDASNAAGDANTGKYVDIYCGYTSISSADANEDGIADAILAAKNVEILAAAPQAPSVNTAEGTSELYTATPVAGYKKLFIELSTVADAANWTPTHDGTGSEIYYSTQRQGYDCLLNTEATTLADILAELTWTNVAPANQIAKYGDYDNDGIIEATDVLGVKRYVLKLDSATMKQQMVGDVDADCVLEATDVLALKRVVLKLDSENDFAVLK